MRIWRAIREPTVRLRLTTMYASIFGFCAVVLLAITFVLTANWDTLFPEIGRLLLGASLGGITTGGAPILPNTATTGAYLNPGQVQLAIANRQAETLTQLMVAEAIALVAMLTVAIVLSWFAAGRVLRPLRSITATARRLSEQNLQQRVALQGPHDELRDLADTIDSMLDRLATAFEAQRRFVANASHELRTPLTRERALVDITLADSKASVRSLRAMGRRVIASVDEQERLIDGLLSLARGEKGVPLRERVDLATVAMGALAQVRGLPGHADAISLQRDLDTAEVVGDPDLLERVVVNLLDNALTHNFIGGHIHVTTRLHGGFAVLEVSNTGPVIPNELVPTLFEPFRRRGQDRSGRHRGHGLGLSIVASLVAAHGGTVQALPRESGGLDVTVLLPRVS